MADFKIKKGYMVPILGEAQKEIVALKQPTQVGISPHDFKGLKPKLLVQIGDRVKIGTPLFQDKAHQDIKFLSPATGKIANVVYGPRRVLEEISIEVSGKAEYESFPKHTLEGVSKLDKDALKTELMAGGQWPYLRQRPFNKIASPDTQPKAVFVNCMDTAPLAGEPGFALKEYGTEFEAGVRALKVLCENVHVVTAPETSSFFKVPSGVSSHTFSGKHPAGLVGTHIAKLSPINRGEVVWYMNARDAVMVGSFLLTGQYPNTRIVALTGPGVAKPVYLKTQIGIRIKEMVQGRLNSGENRLISGSVLHGQLKSPDQPLNFYESQISVVPETKDQTFLGWLGPALNKPSFTKAMLTGFMSGKKFPMNTNLNGGHRAIIQSGIWEDVIALDIMPEFLVKAALAKDIEAMEKLGILECDAEDFALCTYVCPSKTEVSQIIADGLALMEKEG